MIAPECRMQHAECRMSQAPEVSADVLGARLRASFCILHAAFCIPLNWAMGAA